AQPKVVQADVDQWSEPGLDLGAMTEEDERLSRGQVENLGDVPAPIRDLQDFGAIASSPTVRTTRHHIGKKLHVDNLKSVTLARTAPAPLDVEAEHPCVVVSQLGLMSRGEGPTNLAEDVHRGDRVRPTRPADG